MVLEICSDDDRRFAEYSSVPAAFEVLERLDLSSLDRSPTPVLTRSVLAPWTKDYDTVRDNHPTQWPARFDVGDWQVFAAFAGSRRVGGLVVAVSDAAVGALGGRRDCAILWDLRVAPDARGRGIGRALLARAENAAIVAERCAIDVETQDINVPACRLYAAAGYRLRDVTPDAYEDAPGQARLIWSKALPMPGR